MRRLLAVLAAGALAAGPVGGAVGADPDRQPPLLSARAVGAALELTAAPRHALADTGTVTSREDAEASRADAALAVGALSVAGPATVVRLDAAAAASTGRAEVTGAALDRVAVTGLVVDGRSTCDGSAATVHLGRLVVDGQVVAEDLTAVPRNTRITTGGPRGPLVILLNEQLDVPGVDEGRTVKGLVVYAPVGDITLAEVTTAVGDCPR
jgi:hypothetical protein